MSIVTWHLLEICSGTGDDDVRVYAVELDVDDTAIEPRRTSLVAERDRGWARAHLCLDYLLFVGSRDDRMPLDGLSLFQGHVHVEAPGATLDVQPVCVWVDERARRRYEPTAGNAHAPLLFEALADMPFVASPQELVALACAARQRMRSPTPRRAPRLSGAPVQAPPISRPTPRRVVAAALAQCALSVLLVFGGSPPSVPQLAMGSPLTNIVSSAGQVVVGQVVVGQVVVGQVVVGQVVVGQVVVGQAQPSCTPVQMESMRFAVLRAEEPEEPEAPE